MARVEERIDAGFVASTAAEDLARPRVRGDLARMPWVSLAIITVMVLGAMLAPLIAPHSPTEQSLPDKLRPPAWEAGGSTRHLLGTDVLGRDVLSRLIYGRSEEHTSELQSRGHLVCRLLLEKKK